MRVSRPMSCELKRRRPPHSCSSSGPHTQSWRRGWQSRKRLLPRRRRPLEPTRSRTAWRKILRLRRRQRQRRRRRRRRRDGASGAVRWKTRRRRGGKSWVHYARSMRSCSSAWPSKTTSLRWAPHVTCVTHVTRASHGRARPHRSGGRTLPITRLLGDPEPSPMPARPSASPQALQVQLDELRGGNFSPGGALSTPSPTASSVAQPWDAKAVALTN